jgi:hypothetical protein
MAMHRILNLALVTAAVISVGSPAVSASKMVAEVTPEGFELFSLTMSQARQNAIKARSDAYALMDPAEQAAAAPRYADLAGPNQLAESAAGLGVEAAFTTSTLPAVGPEENLSTRRRLEAAGAANENTARKSKGEAAYRDPPRYDDKGYYFSYAQTRRYYANRYTDRVGLYNSAYYELLRCRSARPVGLLGSNPAWRSWSWRVCPDADGRYRPTL